MLSENLSLVRFKPALSATESTYNLENIDFATKANILCKTANNKGTDQTVHMHSLISAFVVCKGFELGTGFLKVLLNNEPVHEISNNMVCATCNASDQPAQKRSLIRAFASRLSIL